MDSLRSVAIQLLAAAVSRLTETISKLPEGSEKMMRLPSGETRGDIMSVVWLVSATRFPDTVSARKSRVADPGSVSRATTIFRLSGIHEKLGVPAHVGKFSKICLGGWAGSAG